MAKFNFLFFACEGHNINKYFQKRKVIWKWKIKALYLNKVEMGCQIYVLDFLQRKTIAKQDFTVSILIAPHSDELHFC